MRRPQSYQHWVYPNTAHGESNLTLRRMELLVTLYKLSKEADVYTADTLKEALNSSIYQVGSELGYLKSLNAINVIYHHNHQTEYILNESNLKQLIIAAMDRLSFITEVLEDEHT